MRMQMLVLVLAVLLALSLLIIVRQRHAPAPVAVVSVPSKTAAEMVVELQARNDEARRCERDIVKRNAEASVSGGYKIDEKAACASQNQLVREAYLGLCAAYPTHDPHCTSPAVRKEFGLPPGTAQPASAVVPVCRQYARDRQAETGLDDNWRDGVEAYCTIRGQP